METKIKRVGHNVISIERAIQLANDWHGGSNSPLYQFASSGVYLVENHLLYLEEIIQEIHRPETALKPFFRPKKQTQELQSLANFFVAKGKQIDIDTTFGKDSYGIVPLPVLLHAPDDKKPLIKPITRLQ